MPHGRYESFYPDGKLEAKGSFKNGVFEGRWEEWYANGKTKSITVYKSGKLIEGDFWDENGTQVVKECTGTIVSKFPDGKIKSIQSFKDCKMHGKWSEWHENGNKASEIFFENGISVGTWTYWNEDGSMSKIEKYSLGILDEE